jgi:DNA-binding transcriptional MerR regulator
VLTIGEFSRLTQLPTKTLRYYDDIGLFKPARIDPFTQYRYYSVEQLPRLYRLLALKGLGLSLDQIARLLDEDLPAEQIRGMLRLKQAELQGHIAAEQSRLAYVEAKLRQLEEDGKMSEYEVILKDVEPVRVASITEVVPGREQIGPALGRLFQTIMGHLNTHHSAIAGPATAIYHDMEYNETNILLEATLPVANPVPETEQIKVKTLSAQKMASLIHKGPFSMLEPAYDAMFRWIDANGYRIIAPSRELTLQYDPNGDPNDYVTELQFPVAKRES